MIGLTTEFMKQDGFASDGHWRFQPLKVEKETSMSPAATLTSIDVPHVSQTAVTGISDAGKLVGYYTGDNGKHDSRSTTRLHFSPLDWN
jgi:hypothetical protein